MYIFISFEKSYDWGGEGKRKRGFGEQNDIRAKPFRKTKSCTEISLARGQAPQFRENSNERKKIGEPS